VRAHLARQNPAWRDFEREVLVVFQGPHAYVSPRWYVSEPETSRVPTWNYVVVHAYGRARVLGDEGTMEVVEALTREHEGEDGWRPDLSTKARQGMLRAIVGFELEELRLEGKLKLSQNRLPADRDAVEARMEPGLAELMAQLRR
jgi:transcriptional regulator